MFFITGCVTVSKKAVLLLQRGGNPKQSWAMVSAELANPTVSSQKDLCELHGAVLIILPKIINYDFAPTDADYVAEKSYNSMLKNCNTKDMQFLAENQYAVYFNTTIRPGLAIPHVKKSISFCDNAIRKMSAEENLAYLYGSMGQFELRDYQMLRAIKIGREYFGNKPYYLSNLTRKHDYILYKNLLQHRMDNLSQSEDRSSVLTEMHQLFDEIKTISKDEDAMSIQYLTFTYAAQRFSAVGDIAFARKLLNEAKVLTTKYPHKNHNAVMVDLQSANAKILYDEGKYQQSAELFEDWINKYPKVTARPLDSNSFRLAGLAQESAQKYDLAIDYLGKAIDGFETRRSSFEMKSRGQFISGSIITSYWGLLRSYAGRYLKERNEGDFQSAMGAERKLRARQFGELLGIDKIGGANFDISTLKLESDELLLNYVLTNSAIVMFAISSEWHNLFVIPYDHKSFNNTLNKTRAGLSSPGKSTELTDDLQGVSKTILGPVADRLSNVKRLIVIPDGYLNGIPFAVLSKSQDQYHPVIKEHEVLLIPSISYLIAQRNSKQVASYNKELFALADPSYSSNYIPEEYRDDTSVFYTRAVNALGIFTPLPETRNEVENISHLFGEGKTLLLMGKEASKTKVKSEPLQGYRYLHFATHGILGNQIPGVNEPALVLAAENSSQSSFLTLSDIEELKLNSDLTVLSACDTGSGIYYTGEGVMGLSRGFLLAGSRSVLASLWPIDSESTVKFMMSFYQHLQSGESKSESLRLTQLEFISGKEGGTSTERGVRIIDKNQQHAKISHPFYWASFVLTGE